MVYMIFAAVVVACVLLMIWLRKISIAMKSLQTAILDLRDHVDQLVIDSSCHDAGKEDDLDRQISLLTDALKSLPKGPVQYNRTPRTKVVKPLTQSLGSMWDWGTKH